MGGPLTKFHFLLLTRPGQPMPTLGCQRPRAGISVIPLCIGVSAQEAGPEPPPPWCCVQCCHATGAYEILVRGKNSKGPFGRFYKRRLPLCPPVSLLWWLRLGGGAVKVSPFLPFSMDLNFLPPLWTGPRSFSLLKFASKTSFSFYLKNDFNGLIFNRFFM